MKKTKIWNFTLKFMALSFFGTLLMLPSCKEEDEPIPPADDAIASFVATISETNYLEVSFANFSQNDVSWAWDFGDGATSVEENPTHEYNETGEYTITLVVKNSDGKESNPFSETITITDPLEAFKLLTGEVSKTWKLFREGIAMSLGPNAGNPAGWWAGLQNNGVRPCLYYQEFTFHFDGKFVFDDKGSFWGENDPFAGTALHETCFEPTPANMKNKDGADVSAWASGEHAFEYDPSTGEVTLNGMGAWMGFVHTVGMPDKYSNVPTASRTFNIEIVQEDGYDLMTLTYDYGDGEAGGDGLWTVKYVNYNTGTEPDVVTEAAACDPLEVVSPTELSRTFASDAADQYVLLDTITSGSGIVYGADDPANPTGTKVGKFFRWAGVQYQELQFQISPTAKDINFENITTVSIEVYLPSSNVYSEGGLTDKVIIGLGETTCPPDWWTDNIEYSTEAVAKDQWVTLTYDITTPSYVAKPENGASPKDRNDLDMVYINFGGGGHTVGGEFYLRNLKFE